MNIDQGITSPYPRLAEPLQVGPLRLPHRVIMGSMHLGLEDDINSFDALAEFYAVRARGGAGLMITGGFSPNNAGRLAPGSSTFHRAEQVPAHRKITERVHQSGGLMGLQLLHSGRYGMHPDVVSASATQAPISPFPAQELSDEQVLETIDDFAHSTRLARESGYDAVEIMGSEGYLVNQFLSPATNHRTDRWGGSPENRRRFAVELARAVRKAAGTSMAVIFRFSMVDLIPQGQTFEETLQLAVDLEEVGVDLLNTGIGWHESRVPTIATSVPRAAFTRFTAQIRQHLSIPVSASNRITMPATAERILEAGDADAVTMSRPFLADPLWINRAFSAQEHLINACIGCNQACLDHTFTGRNATCLVNPYAGRETELLLTPTRRSGQRVAVVGGGPAGLAAALTAAQRGFDVELIEASAFLGGQFRLARDIPGKEEFSETLRYFRNSLQAHGVRIRLGTAAEAHQLAKNYDHVVIASGVRPRELDIPGIDRPEVHSYAEVIKGEVVCGDQVAIIGAGGIGFDVAEFLIEQPLDASIPWSHGPDVIPNESELMQWYSSWGVDPEFTQAGGLMAPTPAKPARQIHLLQRKSTKLGAGLGVTTGWVHRAVLRAHQVKFHAGVTYQRIDDQGLHIEVDGAPSILKVTDIVICAGQESVRPLAQELQALGVEPLIVGGADVAAELDAKRAIDQATRAILELP